MAIGIVMIVTNAKKNDLNLVFAAMGLGPESITRKLCAVNPNATHETNPTFWASFDATGNTEKWLIQNGMTQGDLPPLPEGVVWGENGVISAALAMAACNSAQVYSCAGDVEPVDFILGVPDGNGNRPGGVFFSRGLQYVPDPPA